ncbi:MAG: glutamine--tRNA ligase, partial [Salinicola sp.]|uniref:glutamate--tRNA ligase family protein n=1 Tax=Salinicola sp. TaxID=1978524 RepID=UPI001DE82E89
MSVESNTSAESPNDRSEAQPGAETTHGAPNFLRNQIRDEIESGQATTIVTRFPPEPNGFLHIGHAKSIWVNFGLAEQFGGRCHLRFDDTNPAKEEQAYIDAIQEDIRWLGFAWGNRRYFASDYFERLYAFATALIEKGLAFVDSSSLEEIR